MVLSRFTKMSMAMAFSACLFQQPAKPLSETTANVLAVGGGAIAGGLAGFVTYKATEQNTLAAVLVGLGVGGTSWYLLNEALFALTPRGKYIAATKIISWVENDSLVVRDFSTADDLFGFVNVRFGTSWPLVLTREHLMSMVLGLNEAKDLLLSASSELRGQDDYYGLLGKCKEQESKIVSLSKIIEARVMFIVKQQDYSLQVKLYEQHQEAERQRVHEVLLQSNALWHDTMEKASDRYHDGREKKLDRRVKYDAIAVANANGAPVVVGV